MGCYGIGICRIAAAAIEQDNDANGIIWPKAITPFEIVICPMGWNKSETVRNAAQSLYNELISRGADVILDDRDIRPGVMFADWELIGVPLRITVGERGLNEDVVEIPRDDRAKRAADQRCQIERSRNLTHWITVQILYLHPANRRDSHCLTNMATETLDQVSILDIRVYYEDTDAGGVVYYANYLKFFERGRTEWLRRLGVDQSELAKREQRMFVVKKAEIQYLKPARLDDVLAVHSKITRVGPASIDFEQLAMCSGELLCRSSIQVCCVDTNTFRPAAFTHELRTLLEKVQK